MADNLSVTAGSGSTIGMDEVVDGTLGTVKVGFGKIMDGTIDSTNKLIVNSSGEALTHATQSGTWNVNNVSGTVSLPTGAATAAKQPALGTAGTPSSDVITVQGKSGMTAVITDNSGVTQPVSAASLPLPTGASTSANQTTGNSSLSSIDGKLVTAKTDDYDTGVGTDTIQSIGLALPASGGHVVGGTSSNPLRTDPTGTTTQPISGTVTANAGTGTMAVSAASLPLPSGAATSAKQPALGTAGTASSDVLTVQGIASMTALKTDGSGVTQPVSGTVTVQQSTASSLKVDLSGTAANSTAIKVDNSAVTQPVSGTVTSNQGGTWNVGLSKTGTGYSVSSQTALTTTATVSSAAGKFGGAMFINLNSAPAYIQVFDTTGAVTLGTTTPTFVIPIPANATAANGVGFVLPLEVGIAIANGIKVAATTTATGSTTVSTGLCGFIWYA